MAQKIITVVGVTGKQGSSVANVFLKEPGWHVRGITRDPSKPSAKVWADKGVELVAGDLNDAASLTKAFAGSAVIFGVTDFWGNLSNPNVQAAAQKSGRPINVEGYDVEVQQGRNIVDAANATVATLERFVLSTLSPTKKLSGGKYTHNYHFDAKWEAVEYLKEKYPELEKKTSFLQVGLYMTNWNANPLSMPAKQSDGSYVLSMPMDGDAPVPMVDARHDTGTCTKALVQVPPGKNLLAFGSMMSWNEWVALWGKIHGVKCTFVRMDRKVVENAIPGGVGEEYVDMLEYTSDFGYDGGDKSVVHPKDLGVDVPVVTVEEFIKGEDWSSVLG
ncbi:NAD(P)-binding protein [Cadophora sp. DSE1049]|nr:NAD(P)-binding protein [Cadophora sp. DSE1049]